LLEFTDLNEGDLDDNSASTAVSRLSSGSTMNEDKDTELRMIKNENKKLSDMVKEYKILLTMYR
jgi:hypothetical protein